MSEFESESALAMQVDRVHKSCFVFLFPRRGSPEGSEGWLGPRGRCVSPRADPRLRSARSELLRLSSSTTPPAPALKCRLLSQKQLSPLQRSCCDAHANDQPNRAR